MPQTVICIHYAQQDQALARGLLKHLSTLEKGDEVRITDTTQILAGGDYIAQRNAMLAQASIILLLLSPSLLDKKDDMVLCEFAIQISQEQSTRVIPIRLKHMVWDMLPTAKLHSLPANGVPLLAQQGNKRDEAFTEIVQSIRELITAEEQNEAASEQEFASNLSFMQYLYISEAKLQQLKEQSIMKRVLQRFTRTSLSLSELLDLTLSELDKKGCIGTIGSQQQSYWSGRQLMRWGHVNWGNPDRSVLSLFFSCDRQRILLMGGSTKHLSDQVYMEKMVAPSDQFLAGSSTFPGILHFLGQAMNHNMQWGQERNDITSYLFVLLLVHGKYVNQQRLCDLPEYFPQQHLQFVTQILGCLPKPSAHDLRAFLNHRLSLTEKERLLLQKMVQNAPDIYICSPLYVASALYAPADT